MLGDILSRRVGSRPPPPQILQELERSRLEECGRILQLFINSLNNSMPQRRSNLLAVRDTLLLKQISLKETPFFIRLFSSAQMFSTQMLNAMQFFLPNMCKFFSYSLPRLSITYQSYKQFPQSQDPPTTSVKFCSYSLYVRSIFSQPSVYL